MSHQQKISFNDVLTAHIVSIEARHPELGNFSEAVRYLVVMGLAAEYQRQAAVGAVVQNPFLFPPKELMDP